MNELEKALTLQERKIFPSETSSIVVISLGLTELTEDYVRRSKDYIMLLKDQTKTKTVDQV